MVRQNRQRRSMDEEVWSRRSRSGVIMSRTKSLTHDDLDELKGCLDLGFGFGYNEIPELCNTLPALELCYFMSQRFLDDQQQSRSAEDGDDPDEVKARLRYWAQAVACTVKLCN